MGADVQELRALREEYRLAKEELRFSELIGTADEAMKLRCREAKAAFRHLLRADGSAAGAEVRHEKKERPIVGRRIGIPRCALASMASPLPAALRQQQIFSYDTARFPFRELVADVLGVSPAELPCMHEVLDPGTCGATTKSCASSPEKLSRPKLRSTDCSRRWHAAQGSEARRKFHETLHTFICEFVVPRMRGTSEELLEHNHEENIQEDHVTSDEISEQPPIAYQRDPTFRVQVPAEEPLGYLHSDADYHHPPAEVNWWLPVTKVWGSNTLHIESEPGRGDFTPAELEYGQVLRFYGNLCQHHTVANITDSCRVSFDFRVLSLLHHDPDWVDQHGRKCIFELGGFYQPVMQEGAEEASNNLRVFRHTECHSKKLSRTG